MKVVRTEISRRLVPAAVVAAVLVFSFFATSPSLASSTNNCGVKGYGYHDHGKPCPNRPFPGHGKGVLRILASISGTSVVTTTTEAEGRSDSETTATSQVSIVEDTESTTAVSTSHGKGRGHGHGRGNQA